MRRLCAFLLAVGLVGAMQGCGHCVHGICDCVDHHGQPLDLGPAHPADLGPPPPQAISVETMPKTMPVGQKDQTGF